MGDKGPLLTSGVIFFLSIGAAIFQILEEPHLKSAMSEYALKKDKILQQYPCLKKEDLDKIVESLQHYLLQYSSTRSYTQRPSHRKSFIFNIVSEAAGQGVTIIGKKPFNNWNWPNAVIFAATVITTIGYGNVAPKTAGGRIFCILYGLCGIPLCLTWISELGTFFGGRAKRLSQVLIHRGFTARKVQFTCTAIFLLWGLLLHLVVPPFVFMALEGWSYLEGLYFSFTTLTTVGFGDYVAGVNPNIDYMTLYRFFVEVWIYMGLAWLSLFFSWNLHMVGLAHKVLKKRRHQRRHRLSMDYLRQQEEDKKPQVSSTIDIFNFMGERDEDYTDVIRQIGEEAKRKKKQEEEVVRSKSCSDILDEMVIRTLEHSPRLKRRLSISDNICIVISKARDSLRLSDKGRKDQQLLEDHSGDGGDPVPEESGLDRGTTERPGHCAQDSREHCPPVFQNPNVTADDEENADDQGGGGIRFTVSKVLEDDLVGKEGMEG